jgi:hypothetical protein
MDIGVVGEHDVTGHIEGEAVVLDRPAPSPNPICLLQQDRVSPEMVGCAQAGGTCSDDDYRYD